MTRYEIFDGKNNCVLYTGTLQDIRYWLEEKKDYWHYEETTPQALYDNWFSFDEPEEEVGTYKEKAFFLDTMRKGGFNWGSKIVYYSLHGANYHFEKPRPSLLRECIEEFLDGDQCILRRSRAR